MTDDLRTRIAAVLYEDGQRPMNTAVRLADAVIRELGLRRESPQLCPSGSNRYRYVTEWTDNGDAGGR